MLPSRAFKWIAGMPLFSIILANPFSFSEVRINFVYPDTLTLISTFIPEHCSAYNGPFTCVVLVFLKKPINLSQLRIISLVCSGRMDIGKYSCCSLALVTASLQVGLLKHYRFPPIQTETSRIMEILLAMKRISLKDRITNICSIPAPNKNI